MVKEKRTQDNLALKSIWEPDLVANVLREAGSKPKHAHTIWKHLIRNTDVSLIDVPFDSWMIARKVSNVFKQDFTLFTTKIVQKEVSIRGDTTKLLIELQDGHRVIN
jgi:adenine C2-methylase RlmN of 23S rRNA A2503 and tRNA A37